MKSLIFIFLLIGIIAFVGCTSAQVEIYTYTIEVSGTNGLAFTGRYGGITPEGETVTQSVAGVVPAEYTVKAASDYFVYCSFVKLGEVGTLNVFISKNGQVVTQAGTAAAFGSVTLAAN